MKTKNRNFLAVIFAMLCAAAIALGIGFALPKNNKTAEAATVTDLFVSGGYLNESVLNTVASKAGYSDCSAMIAAVRGGTNIKSGSFGMDTVTFGGKKWYPVYATRYTGTPVLVLWYSANDLSYRFSDGSVSTNSNATITSGNYYYSWIHAALNAGKTNYGSYCGNFKTAYHDTIENSKGSDYASAPTSVKTFAEFAKGGTYSSVILDGAVNKDKVRLPYVSEIGKDATWGCSSSYWISQWTATSTTSYAYAVRLTVNGAGSNESPKEYLTVKPVIYIDLTKVITKTAAPADVAKTYRGSAYTLADIAGDWYISSAMKVTLPEDMTAVGERYIKVTITSQYYTFKGSADPDKGDGDESDKIRYFKFTINPRKVHAPTFVKTLLEYDSGGIAFCIDQDDGYYNSNLMYVNLISDGITWDGENEQFTVTGTGAYTVSFSLIDKDNSIWRSTGNNGDLRFTLTVTGKKITAPTVSPATQEYSPNGCTFTVTGFDGDIMTADGVAWSAASGVYQYKAKNAGTHTVSFCLIDKTNCVWASTGNNDDISVPLTVNKKQVTIDWSTQQQTGADGGQSYFFMLPTLNVTYDVQQLVGEVKYYKANNCTVSGNTIQTSGSPVRISEIQKEQEYYAVVEISDAVKNNYDVKGKLFCSFDTLDDRTIVVVSITNSGEDYNGNQHTAQIKAVDSSGSPLTVGTDIFIQVIYKLEGDGVYGGEGSAAAPTNAGNYTVVVSIAPNSEAGFRLADSQELKFIINKINPVLDPVTNATELIAGGLLSDVTINQRGSNSQATAGAYSWENPSAQIKAGTNGYAYTFTPDDAVNYNTVAGTFPLTVYDAEIETISATFNLPDGVTLYTSTNLESLKKYFTVTGTKNNGEQVTLAADEFILDTASGLLNAGTCNVTVYYAGNNSVNCTCAIEGIVEVELAQIEAQIVPADGKKISVSATAEELQQWLHVNGKNNDGTPYGTIDGLECTLLINGEEDGQLVAGKNTVTVTYNGISCEIQINVKDPTAEKPAAGIAALWETVKSFMTGKWLKLPYWAWLLIALAVLVLLIIIIVVAVKRRKTKEEREEIKARKQEEKERLEEEQRMQQETLEEERRMQQEMLEAERELEKARKEAELEIVKAQAQVQAAGAAGTVIVQPQQTAQQPIMQQPVMQEAPVQPSGGRNDVMLALLQSQVKLQERLAEMRATNDASTKAEMEKLKMQMLKGNLSQVINTQDISAELLGEAIVTAFTKLAAKTEKPAVHTAPETETATASAVYPPDAVVTTTMAVDTTQNTVRTEGGESDTVAGVDVFYDNID